MKRMKTYLIAALYCLVVSCTTSKKIEQDDDFATEATDATLSAEPSQSNADLSEFDLKDDSVTAAPAETTQAAPAEKDEFAEFNEPAPAQPQDANAAQGTATAQTNPEEKDAFAEFEAQAQNPDQNGQAPTEQTPPPVIAEQTPPPAVENAPPPAENNLNAEATPQVPIETPAPEVSAPPVVAEAPKAEVPPEPQPEPLTKIEQVFYKPNQNGGAITIEGDHPLQFTTRLNSVTNQLVVEVQNSLVPAKLKRSLNTKDMASSIGSVDIYQKANSKIARFVVQLRPGAAEPLVQPEGNSVLIIGAANEAFVAKQKADAERSAMAKLNPQMQPQEGFVDLSADGIMSTQNLEEFLIGNQKFYGKKISIETNNLDVKEAIKFIAEESGANLLMDDGLEGKISLKLRQVPWDQALVLILKAKKLGYVRQGNVLRIAKLSDLQNEESEAYKLLEARRSNEPMIVKRFFISYAKLDDIQIKIRDFMVATAPIPAAPVGGSAANNQAGGTQQPGSRTGAGAASGTSLITASPTGSSITQPGGSTSADALALQNKITLGRVIADERTGSLIVTDTKENMAKIEKLIAALDTQPKQIVVESRIVNATETFSKSIGFNWTSGGSTVSNQNSAKVGITPFSAIPKSAIVNTTFSWKNLDVIGNLDATIALGELQDKVKVLNTQRITVSSGKAAQIGAESKLRIPTVQTNVGGAGATAIGTSSFDTVTYGLKGTIVPQASNENTVFADVDLQQIALTKAETGDTTSNQLGGRVLAQSGQTVVVNAGFQSRNSATDSGVPGLRDVPVLGMLFKGKSEEMSKAETLVFVTMTILEPVTGIFKKAAGDINSEPSEPTQQTQ